MPELEFARRLSALGVPLFAATAPGPGGSEFARPSGWQRTDPAGNLDRLARFTEGAVCALLGDPLAVVDVDTKNGADPDAARAWLDALGVPVLADVATPSGGRHFYVPGHPDLPTVHAAAGRDGLDGLPGVELLAHGTNVFAPGTTRPSYGGRGYVVLADRLDDWRPELAEHGARLAAWIDAHRAGRPDHGAPDAPATPWDGRDPDARERAYLDAAVTRTAERVAACPPGGRNEALFTGALKLGSLVAGAGLDEGRARQALTDAAAACGLTAGDGPAAVRSTIRSGLSNGRRNPRPVPPPRDDGPTLGRPKPHPRPSGGPVGAPAAIGEPSGILDALGRLLGNLRRWQHLPDPTHVVAALATAATRDGVGEPCWLLLVAPPSSGKTEAVRILDDAADDCLDEVTAAGLLGWSKAKTATPSGVLARCGPRALVTFGDLSSLLATSDRGGRDQVFGLLRRAYDGHVTRDVSPPGRTDGTTQLAWSGRLTVVGCVTGAIDRYTAHADALGARWLYCRLPDRTLAEKRHAAQLARRGGLAGLRLDARQDAAAILAAARVPATVPDAVLDAVEDAALVTAWGRAAVPRNGYGRREIEGVPIVEEPMRLVQQLGALGGGVLALGLPEDAAVTVCRRVALDSMPAARYAVLLALATGEVLSTSGVARAAALDRKVARFTLEELAAVGVVESDHEDAEEDESTGPVNWCLTGAEGAVIADVFAAARAAGGWDEMWVPTPPPPQRGDRQPTFRPTPEPHPDKADQGAA